MKWLLDKNEHLNPMFRFNQSIQDTYEICQTFYQAHSNIGNKDKKTSKGNIWDMTQEKVGTFKDLKQHIQWPKHVAIMRFNLR